MKYCFVGPLRQNLFANLNFALLLLERQEVLATRLNHVGCLDKVSVISVVDSVV